MTEFGVPADSYNRSGLLAALGNDQDLLSTIEGLFLDEAAPHQQIIESSLSVQDFKGLESEAHRLKGAAWNLQAPRLAEAAQALEAEAQKSDSRGCKEAWSRLKPLWSGFAAAMESARN